MYSMNYIGKFIANFREFYNEINGATLTGAIDVVVVEQPDGNFTCSPFHVRFGKLGVLRSRFKVVDLELNGEPLNIHMKLGESGEAFFVEEVPEDELEASAHLATSPIPQARFDELYEPRRRNSLSAVEPDHSHASEYTKRRYTADGQTMQKPDFSKLTKTEEPKKEEAHASQDHEALFEMEGLDEPTSATSWNDVNAPKTFVATEVGEAEKEVVRKISVHNDFRPIETQPEPPEDNKQNGNGKKKKKTKKAGSKKKHQRKSSSGSNSYSSQSERAGSEQRTPQTIPAPIPNPAEVNFFSDTEITSAVLRGGGSRSGTPVLSDTEVELGRGTGGDKSSQSWRWGELPDPAPRTCAGSAPSPASPIEPGSPTEPLSSDEERARRSGVLGMFSFMSRDVTTTDGVYLDDLTGGQVDPDLYFPKNRLDNQRTGGSTALHVSTTGPTEEEYESGNGPSLPQSPNSLEPPHMDSDDDDKIFTKGYIGLYVRDGSVSRALPFEEFCNNGAELLAGGRLLVRVGEKYLPWGTAGPLILSLLAYRRSLPNRVVEALSSGGVTGSVGSNMAASDSGAAKPRGYSWWSWRRSNQPDPNMPLTSPPTDKKIDNETKLEQKPTDPSDKQEDQTELKSDKIDGKAEKTDVKFDNIDGGDTKEKTEETEPSTETDVETAEETEVVEQEQSRVDNKVQAEAGGNSSSDSEDTQVRPRYKRRHSTFRKTLRLSSEQIAGLNLREGINEMVFSVTTAYQGTTRCKCNLFRWRHDDKIVISDIDGTITKSDVLGHIFPLVGKDWAQSGVAQLFTKINNNGYKLLYLSARAIGQAKVTREYLRSIRQGEVSLPDGPLLLNPTSLLRAFHREVIEKKPEEFKIQCLADIKALFPQGSSPFYAGYGNRVNDVCAYQAVGIPIVRIFTINYKGELKHELTQTFQSTYSHMSVLVDQVFPPVLSEVCDDFSQVVFWRDPIPPLDLSLPSIAEHAH